MNDEQKRAAIEHLAINVMGCCEQQYGSDWWYVSKDPDLIDFLVSEFNPFENIAQAFDVLDSLNLNGMPFRWLLTNHNKEGYQCAVGSPISSRWDAIARHENQCTAICIAACRATGFEI